MPLFAKSASKAENAIVAGALGISRAKLEDVVAVGVKIRARGICSCDLFPESIAAD